MQDYSETGDAESAGPVRPGVGAVDGFDILKRVVDLPISTWRYEWETADVRHLGPMAQDWSAMFGLGASDTTIATVDANGVSLVAIQALYRLVAELQGQVAELCELIKGKDSKD